MGKDNPEVFIPCRHVCAKFPIRHLRTFSRTPYGHKHGWDTLATQCGRSTPSHAPTEHGTRPTTTWDDYPAMETMHSPAQPRQHASDRTQQAQRRHRPTTPTSTGKRRPHRHTQAWCKGSRAAAARRARRASQPRAAHTPNPCPPACCSPIWLPRRSRLAGQPEEVGESSRGWRGGWVPDARGCP